MFRPESNAIICFLESTYAVQTEILFFPRQTGRNKKFLRTKIYYIKKPKLF